VAVGLLGLSYTASEWLLVAFVGTFGVAQGARGPIVASLSNRLFAGPSAAAIYGVIYASSMVGAAVGAWGSGFLHDVSASYRPALLVAAAGILLAAAPFAFQRALRGPPRGGGIA
jgi:predicted MFS family arabinose efflux permease